MSQQLAEQAAEAQRLRQREVQQDRNAVTLRLTLLINGYLVHEGDRRESRAALTRADLHQQVDDFFDRVEAERQAKSSDEDQMPDSVDHRVVRPSGSRKLDKRYLPSSQRPHRGL